MSNHDLLRRIANARNRCVNRLEDNDDNDRNDSSAILHEQLLAWKQQVSDDLEKFIQEKMDEIQRKRTELNRRELRHLDTMYSQILSHSDERDTEREQQFSQILDGFKNNHTNIQIIQPKKIDFHQYLQLQIDRPRSISALNSDNTNPHLNFSAYQQVATVSVQTNITSLFATHNNLLVYYDHHAQTAYLHVFDLSSYLEQPKTHQSCLKIRIPCEQFQGRIMHIEYCSYLHAFLLATGSKFFTVKISTKNNHYSVAEYIDTVQVLKFPGIVQTFACHSMTTNWLYLLVNTCSQYTIVRTDLNRNFHDPQTWNYPKGTSGSTLTTDNITTKSRVQVTAINDFALGKDALVFAVTYESEDQSTNQAHISYQLHVRSLDMHLQHRLILSNSCPLRICMIPFDVSMTGSQQFIVIFRQSKILSIYDTNAMNNSETPIDSLPHIEEITLDTEPENLSFANNDRSCLLIRNLFHIAIFKRQQSSQLIQTNTTTMPVSLPLRRRSSIAQQDTSL